MGHNHTAYAPEDVDDARRGAPAASLEGWAADRGLSFPGPGLAGALVTVLPAWPEYQFNVCRGELSPGRFGQVAHELHEIEAWEGSIRAGGRFYGTRLTTRRGLKSWLGLGDERPNEPFAANAAWAPTTKVVLRVPEAALHPRVVIRNAERIGADHRDLGPHGLAGYRMARSEWIDEQMEARLADAARPLGGVHAAYVALVLDHGLLAVQRNGFVADPAVLGHLVEQTAAVAAALGSDAGAPGAFQDPLPAPDHEQWPGFLRPQPNEVDLFGRAAQAFGLVQEDAVALHSAFRRLPFPGRALAVLRGRIPGTTSVGRIVFAGQGGRTSSTYRTVVLVAAAPGVTTPVGGVRHEPTDMYAEVADGVVAAWPRVRTANGVDAEATIGRAVTTLRDLALAAV